MGRPAAVTKSLKFLIFNMGAAPRRTPLDVGAPGVIIFFVEFLIACLQLSRDSRNAIWRKVFYMLADKSNHSAEKRLVRVAACNFSETIFDTDDLSTIRGGSLLLLEFPKKLLEKFDNVQEIAAGASELLFITAASEDEIDKVCASFYQTNTYQHFTFVHASTQLPDETSFKTTLDILVRECNIKQYQQPTVKDYPAGDVACEFTGVLPAAAGELEKQKLVSASVKLRRIAGRRAKQDFYDTDQDPLIPEKKGFANEFSDMRPSHEEEKTLPESIKGKMAVLYLDGNSFRNAREKNGVTPEAYKNFSNSVTAHRQKLLTDVVKHIVDTDKNHNVLRLETLLWGGDEVMWVLPAFKAWEFMQVVQTNLKKEIWDGLTHSCGLLIAPYKAPIKDLRALVNNLGDVAKDCPDGRKMNGVQIEFIKGFDLPGLSADDLRNEFLDDGDDHRAFQLDGARWEDIDKAMRGIKGAVPRSALHRAYQKAVRDGLHRPEKAAEASAFVSGELTRIETVNGQSPDERKLRDYLTDGLPGALDAATRYPLIPLRQVLQFWDLVPENNGGAQ